MTKLKPEGTGKQTMKEWKQLEVPFFIRLSQWYLFTFVLKKIVTS